MPFVGIGRDVDVICMTRRKYVRKRKRYNRIRRLQGRRIHLFRRLPHWEWFYDAEMHWAVRPVWKNIPISSWPES